MKFKDYIKEVRNINTTDTLDQNLSALISSNHLDKSIQLKVQKIDSRYNRGKGQISDKDKEWIFKIYRTKIKGMNESMSRHSAVYKAKNGKWYLELADREYGEQHEADLFGPFPSEKSADDYLSQNFSNPGGGWTDASGKQPVPKSAPNGSKIINPKQASVGRSWLR